jgi:hypothetical protein
MWRKQHEYSLAQLLDHPVLGLVMKSQGMDRRSVELLLEAGEDERDRGTGEATQPLTRSEHSTGCFDGHDFATATAAAPGIRAKPAPLFRRPPACIGAPGTEGRGKT